MKLTENELKGLLSKATPYRKGNLKANCPKCGENEFYISTTEDNHPFQCWRKKRCGYSGNIFTLLKELGKLHMLGDYKTTDVNKPLENKLSVVEEEINADLPTLKLPLGFKKLDTHPYLEQRLFCSHDKITFGITTLDPFYSCPVGEYLIFIIKQNDKIKGLIGRHTWSKIKLDEYNKKRLKEKKPIVLRYKNSSTDFSKLLWGIDEIGENTHTVILVEGLFDKDRVDALLELDKQDDIKCCCTFGSSLSKEQIFLLQNAGIKKLIILHESDVIDKVKATASTAGLYFESVLVGYVNKMDPGDMFMQDLEEVLLDLQNYSKFSISKVKIRKFV